jgi:hypothetical protein
MNTIKKKSLSFILVIFSCSKRCGRLKKQIKKDIKVLIVGNSILRHGPASSIGWYGDWGTLAFQIKIFLHVYNKLLQVSDKYNYVNMYSKKNIAVGRLIYII